MTQPCAGAGVRAGAAEVGAGTGMVILSLGHVAHGELKLNVSVATVRFVRSLIGCLFLRLHCKALLQRWPQLKDCV